MTLFCANNTTSNSQHGVTSHYPSVSGEPQPRALRGYKSGRMAPQMYPENFTVRGGGFTGVRLGIV